MNKICSFVISALACIQLSMGAMDSSMSSPSRKAEPYRCYWCDMKIARGHIIECACPKRHAHCKTIMLQILMNAVREQKAAHVHCISCGWQVGDPEPYYRLTAVDIAAITEGFDGASVLRQQLQELAKKQRPAVTLFEAAKRGDCGLVERFLADHCCDVNARICEYTPLHIATKNGHKSIVDKLVKDQRCDINAEVDRGVEGGTALHLAARYGYPDIVKLLLDTEQFDRNAKANAGYTPIQEAIMWKKMEVVKTLVNDPRCSIGESEFRMVRQGDPEMARLIAERLAKSPI